MATLSITIPDTKVTRVRAAFGHMEGELGTTPVWQNATLAEVQAWMLAMVKQRVKDYEGRIAAESAHAAVDAEIEAW